MAYQPLAQGPKPAADAEEQLGGGMPTPAPACGSSMDLDAMAVAPGRGSAVAVSATASPGSALASALQSEGLLKQLAGARPEWVWQVLALKMLAEFCLLFGSTVGLLMKRDTELAVAGGHLPAKEAGSRKTCGGEGGERGAEHAWPASCVFVGVGGRCS